jgi:hypothetical protein
VVPRYPFFFASSVLYKTPKRNAATQRPHIDPSIYDLSYRTQQLITRIEKTTNRQRIHKKRESKIKTN